VAPAAKPPKLRSRAWLWLLVVVVVAAAVWYIRSKSVAAGSTTKSASGGASKKGGGRVPVVAAAAHRGDIGVFITGLGSVTPIYTVTIKSRVDGQLMDVHYSEGNIVQKGDLLLEIDPRPYQVQLEQAEGQMVRDQANLENAWILPVTKNCWRRTPSPNSKRPLKKQWSRRTKESSKRTRRPSITPN